MSSSTIADLSAPLPREEYEALGVMPLQDFDQASRARINEACTADRPPGRWLEAEVVAMPSRAFYEWHWRRGRDAREEREPLPRWLRTSIFKRDGGRCAYCDCELQPDRFHVDHVHPVALGGGNEPGNLVATCPPCNMSKGAKTLEEWLS